MLISINLFPAADIDAGALNQSMDRGRDASAGGEAGHKGTE